MDFAKLLASARTDLANAGARLAAARAQHREALATRAPSRSMTADQVERDERTLEEAAERLVLVKRTAREAGWCAFWVELRHLADVACNACEACALDGRCAPPKAPAIGHSRRATKRAGATAPLAGVREACPIVACLVCDHPRGADMFVGARVRTVRGVCTVVGHDGPEGRPVCARSESGLVGHYAPADVRGAK